MSAMRAAIYLRVSSDKQAKAGSIESQRRDVPAMCETAGVRERYQCAGITLLCGRRLHLGAGSNAADMRGGRLVFRSSDAPWSVGRWLTFSERIAAIRDHRSDASRADLGHGRCADQEGARASAQAAALRWIEAQ